MVVNVQKKEAIRSYLLDTKCYLAHKKQSGATIQVQLSTGLRKSVALSHDHTGELQLL